MATSITKPELKQIIKEEILRLSKISNLQQKQTQLLKQLNECGYAMKNDIDEGFIDNVGNLAKAPLKHLGIIKKTREELKKEFLNYRIPVLEKTIQKLGKEMPNWAIPGTEQFEKALNAMEKYNTVDIRYNPLTKEFVKISTGVLDTGGITTENIKK